MFGFMVGTNSRLQPLFLREESCCELGEGLRRSMRGGEGLVDGWLVYAIEGEEREGARTTGAES